jgi:hypothetical protein
MLGSDILDILSRNKIKVLVGYEHTRPYRTTKPHHLWEKREYNTEKDSFQR